MKRFIWISAVAVTVFAMSLNAIAQGQGGGQGRAAGAQGGAAGAQRQAGQQPQGFTQGGGGVGNVATLLRNAEVVKLLNITEAQTTALNEVFPVGRGTNAGTNAPATPPGQQTAAQRRTQTETQWAGIAKVLNADQLKKFKEIYFQANVPVVNPNAAANAPVQVMNLNVFVLGALDLTTDQVTKINAITDAVVAPTPLPQGATPEERQAATAARLAAATKTSDSIKALLTDAQKKKMDELTAGAPKVRTDLNLNPQRGAGAPGGANAPGGNAPGGGRGAQGGGFTPGQGAQGFGGGGAGGGGRGAGGGGRGAGGAGAGN